MRRTAPSLSPPRRRSRYLRTVRVVRVPSRGQRHDSRPARSFLRICFSAEFKFRVCGGPRRKQGRNLNLANEGCFAFSDLFCARLASCAVLDPGGRTGDLYPTPGLPRSRKPAVIVDPTIRRAHIVGHHDECPTNLRRALCHFVSFVEMKYLCVFATI